MRGALLTVGALALVLAAGVVLSLPLYRHEELPDGVDLAFAHHTARDFIAGLEEGVPYPRWVDSSNRGLGAPTFVFYSPLAFYFVAMVAVPMGDVMEGLRYSAILFTLLAGLSFFACARELAGELGAAVGAALYVLLPYHVIDLYERFALAEFCAFVWFPPLFHFARRLVLDPSRRAWLGLCLSYTALVLTHLVTAFMALWVLVPYALALAAWEGRFRGLLRMSGAGAVALLCAGIYLLPMLAHREDAQLDYIVSSDHGDWRRNLLFRDERADGYKAAPIKPMVQAAGISQATLAASAGLILAWRSRRRREREPGRVGAARQEGLLQLALAFYCLALQTPLAWPLWASVPELANVQFPWRFSAFQGLATASLVACTLAPARAGSSARQRVATLALIALASLPALHVASLVPGHREFRFDRARAEWPTIRFRTVKEYAPKGFAAWEEIQHAVPDPLAKATLQEQGQVTLLAWNTQSRHFRIDSPSANRLRVWTFAFPGWTARLDGAKAPIEAHPELRTIEVDIPPGRHDLELTYRATPPARVGALLSLAGLAALVLVGYFGSRRAA